MIYLAAATWDESRDEYRAVLRLQFEDLWRIECVYKPNVTQPGLKLILKDSKGNILDYALREYKKVYDRKCCETWQCWKLRIAGNHPLKGTTMEVSFLSFLRTLSLTPSVDPQERTLLSDLLHSTEPIFLTEGVLFLVRVQPNDMPATTSTPLPAKQPTPAPGLPSNSPKRCVPPSSSPPTEPITCASLCRWRFQAKFRL
jgi:hypothetical protein